jgi:hypothetical protein
MPTATTAQLAWLFVTLGTIHAELPVSTTAAQAQTIAERNAIRAPRLLLITL